MNFAVLFYLTIRRAAPRRSEPSIEDLVERAMRSSTMTGRAIVLADLASFKTGRVDCPHCGSNGPHTSNGHHRFNKLTFTCAKCTQPFPALNVQT